jgi:hypothetical protein
MGRVSSVYFLGSIGATALASCYLEFQVYCNGSHHWQAIPFDRAMQIYNLCSRTTATCSR